MARLTLEVLGPLRVIKDNAPITRFESDKVRALLVYLAVQANLKLPMCNERFGHPMIPFFYPMIRPIEEAYWYLAEDYAFCHRARQCAYRIYADTTIRLWHVGSCRYGWEDAGTDRRRFETFTLNFDDGQGT